MTACARHVVLEAKSNDGTDSSSERSDIVSTGIISKSEELACKRWIVFISADLEWHTSKSSAHGFVRSSR